MAKTPIAASLAVRLQTRKRPRPAEEQATTAGVAPDYSEPVLGWRLWLVVADGGYLWLESLLYPTRWSPRRPLDARCIPHRRCYFCNPKEVEASSPHQAPDTDCECGVYAAATPATLEPYLDSSYPGRVSVERVLGQVRLWGTVIECERGWRGQHAYPNRLYVPLRPSSDPSHELADEIAAGLRDYGIPVSLLPWEETPDVIAAVGEAA